MPLHPPQRESFRPKNAASNGEYFTLRAARLQITLSICVLKAVYGLLLPHRLNLRLRFWNIVAMQTEKRDAFLRDGGRVFAAVGLWLGFGLALGWYYTITYYGRTGLPIPTPDTCAALILYYFSVLNVDTKWQAFHWMLVFPAAGALWTWALSWSARRLKLPPAPFPILAFRLALANAPLTLAAPWLTWVAAQTPDGLSLSHMFAVALRHAFLSPWPALNPTFLVLGLSSLALQIFVYRLSFSSRGAKACIHFLLALIALIAISATIGGLAAIPMRAAFE